MVPWPTRRNRNAAPGILFAGFCATCQLLRVPENQAFAGPTSYSQSWVQWIGGKPAHKASTVRVPNVPCSSAASWSDGEAAASESFAPAKGWGLRQWARYFSSIHGISGLLSILGGSIWTTVRLGMGDRTASHAEVVVNVVLSTLILITGLYRLRTLRNTDLVLKFWVGISIQIFALVQVLEAPLLGWIPHSIFGNWISRAWGVISVYFYIKWLMQLKRWNDAYETKSDKTVARVYHPLMPAAMGSVVVMEVVTFVNFVELHFGQVSRCSAARDLFMDSQLVSLAVNNVAQLSLTLANQKKVSDIKQLFYWLGAIGTVQFTLLMWVHLAHLGVAGLNAFTLIPLMCQGV